MTEHYTDAAVTLHHGDCLDVLRTLPDASVDAVVTDPPYGLGFMGREWDDLPPGREWAEECLRVLKPGGHLLAFGGTRTWHRLACAIEDAGFEVRDSIAWMYGSGFPKSLDVSKAIDKMRTEDRAPVDAVRSWLNDRRLAAGFSHDAVNRHFGHASNGGGSSSAWMTNPTSRSLPTWDQWQELKRLFGFGDDMDAEVWRLNGRKGKPGDNWEAREVVGMYAQSDPRLQSWAEMQGNERGTAKEMRGAATTPDAERWQGWGTALKPAHEPIVVARKPLAGTVAQNVLAHGTGALNVDGCRIAGAKPDTTRGASIIATSTNSPFGGQGRILDDGRGRWPANVILDESQADALDEMSGERPGAVSNGSKTAEGLNGSSTFKIHEREQVPGYGDTGGASRFFYVAKADASERVRVKGTAHPTVKPLALMRWLVRLVTPPGGTVLEPFAGSGTTVEACILEGFHCVAIEREADYLPLIVQRINRRRDPVAAVRGAGEDGGLFDLLDGGVA
jgi:hypothetical protein